MNENITESIEERPELNLDIRRLWCGVIDNAIEDAKGRKLSIVGTAAYRLRDERSTQREAKRFLKSSELDLICDLFLSGIHADTIRKGAFQPTPKRKPLPETDMYELTKSEIAQIKVWEK